MAPRRPPFTLGTAEIHPGTRATVDLPVSVLSDHTPVTMSVRVIHGARPGPTLFVSAAIHGDEVIGVEVARRVLRSSELSQMRGTLMVVPIVNGFGFQSRSRYLPDRRDLNRTFPGKPTGSLAARLAHLFMAEIVSRADLGIDLHSGAIHRTNMPQVRVASGNRETRALADAFGAPIVLMSRCPEGSLREAAAAVGVDVLLYEAGEALRFDDQSARIGALGVLRVMRAMGMLPAVRKASEGRRPLHAHRSTWVRAPVGGLLRTDKSSRAIVAPGDVLGVIADPFGESETLVTSDTAGIIIGLTNLPLVNEGDALFHVATPDDDVDPSEIESLADGLDPALEEQRGFTDHP